MTDMTPSCPGFPPEVLSLLFRPAAFTAGPWFLFSPLLPPVVLWQEEDIFDGTVRLCGSSCFPQLPCRHPETMRLSTRTYSAAARHPKTHFILLDNAAQSMQKIYHSQGSVFFFKIQSERRPQKRTAAQPRGDRKAFDSGPKQTRERLQHLLSSN